MSYLRTPHLRPQFEHWYLSRSRGMQPSSIQVVHNVMFLLKGITPERKCGSNILIMLVQSLMTSLRRWHWIGKWSFKSINSCKGDNKCSSILAFCDFLADWCHIYVRPIFVHNLNIDICPNHEECNHLRYKSCTMCCSCWKVLRQKENVTWIYGLC